MMNKNRQSIFKSPEGVDGKVIFLILPIKVGVMGSGKGMTNFTQKEKYNLNDNSYLWRDFS
jgi:hypothetical protein